MAEEFGVPLLGEIPLGMDTRQGGDAGVPVTVGHPESAQAALFRRVAEAVVVRIEAVSSLALPSIG